MRLWVLILASAITSTGCTTLSLTQHTLAQNASAVGLRYSEVLDNVAMVAEDPSALPAYSSIFTGSAQVTDSAAVGSMTVWNVKGVMGSTTNGYASESAAPVLNRTVLENWTLDPIVIPEKLEAMRCACRWVLYGPERACRDCPGLLASPEQAPTSGRHFGVADRLARLPPSWLHVGPLRDVPAGACYRSHAGDTWVWVTPEGLEGLADFTLVLQDIARVDANSPTLFVNPPAPLPFTFATKPTQWPAGQTAAVSAIVSLDPWMNLVPDTPYYRYRVENVGSDAHVRSQINAAGLR